MGSYRIWKCIFLSLSIFVAVSLICGSLAFCQYWTALPPYNTLWPLWSPALSPQNPATGLPTPIVTNLNPFTVLPVQPGLTWDPLQQYPWLLYNSPFNTLIYYDTVFGMNPWPPPNYASPVPTLVAGPPGTPVPIILPDNFSSLPPTDPTWLLGTIPLVNDYYAATYQYYSNIASSIAPIFPLLPIGYTLPPLLPSFLDSLLTLPITVQIPPFLSATAILGL